MAIFRKPNFFASLPCVIKMNRIVLIAIVIVLAIPIFGLTGFHMVLVARGRTTNEQVTGKFKGGYNPFSRGCWHNCCYTQFGPQYPRYISFPGILFILDDSSSKKATVSNYNAFFSNFSFLSIFSLFFPFFPFFPLFPFFSLFSPFHLTVDSLPSSQNSLMKPQKYSACRSNRENPPISTINANDDQRHMANNAMQPHAVMYDSDQLQQVKTYTDHGNGYGQRSGGTTHYSKVILNPERMPFLASDAGINHNSYA